MVKLLIPRAALLCTLVGALLPVLAGAREPDTAQYAQILHNFVREGLVDYKDLCQSSLLNPAVDRLSATNPDQLSGKDEQLAFWINVYNAYTLKAICDHYPVKSINDLSYGGKVVGTVLKKTVWDKDFVVINGRRTTLNYIEHKIIRPVFRDPRAHFALVCASRSCPPLRPEPFEGSRLPEQLDDQARIFLTDPKRNDFDLKNRAAHLSRIFDWYGNDFGRSDEERLTFVARFVPEPLKSALEKAPRQWHIAYLDYDWSLNGK